MGLLVCASKQLSLSHGARGHSVPLDQCDLEPGDPLHPLGDGGHAREEAGAPLTYPRATGRSGHAWLHVRKEIKITGRYI